MSVVAIVVNYNGWRDTLECVASLLRSDYADLRVWVVDNASTDDSVERLREWATAAAHPVLACGDLPDANLHASRVVVITARENGGFAGGCNIGITEVVRRRRDDYVLLLNNDATIAPDALSAMVRDAGGRPALGALGATILRDDDPEVLEMLGGATANLVGMVTPVQAGVPRSAPRPLSLHLDYVSGCCLLAPVRAIALVGLIDERFFLYSEDVDWGIRMRRAGLHLGYTPAAEVRHKGGASVGHRSPVHDYYMVRGALLLVRKHHPWAVPLALLYWAWRGLLPKLVRGQRDRLRAAVRGYRDFLLESARRHPDAAARATAR